MEHPTNPTGTDALVRLLVAGDRAGVRRALAGDEAPTPERLVVAALVADADVATLLAQAATAARTSRDRQLVAVAAAHLDGDADRVAVLVRDHLVDHPDSLLAAWIAAHSPDRTARRPTHPEE